MINAPKYKIRNLVIILIGGLFLCVIALGMALIVSTNKLQAMNKRTFTDGKALEMCRMFEASILGERRESLLWSATKKEIHLTKKHQELEEAKNILGELPRYVTSQEETDLMRSLEKDFMTFQRASSTPQQMSLEEISAITDTLLKGLCKLSEQNRTQMQQTLEESMHLNTLVNLWSGILIALVGFASGIGAVLILSRILRPTLALTKAAEKFGKGDFAERSRVYRNDELGTLCRTFNDMALNIQKLNRERVHIIAAFVHDLKNPLFIIGGAARRIHKKNLLHAEQSPWLERIIDQIEYLERHLQDLMGFVQIENKSLSLVYSDIDLLPFLKNLQFVQNSLVSTHEITFDAQAPCRIRADRDKLERVIQNVVSNAIKYSPHNTTIHLMLENRGADAVITVKDEGMGIEPEALKDIFQPFTRLNQTREIASGYGIGLYSAKKIVEAHGGSINLSSSVGEGTTVEIFLPGLFEV